VADFIIEVLVACFLRTMMKVVHVVVYDMVCRRVLFCSALQAFCHNCGRRGHFRVRCGSARGRGHVMNR